jgi:hypothetical protein
MHACAWKHGLAIGADRQTGAAAGRAPGTSRDGIVAGEGVHQGTGVRDLVGFWMLGTNGRDPRVRGFAGFRKCIVSGVEVLAFLCRHRRQKRIVAQNVEDLFCTFNLFCSRSFLFGNFP